jgi:phenylacetate-CoA ligase
MTLNEWIKSAIFWVWDFLTGSSIRKHYVDIKNIMGDRKNPKASKLQEHHLNNILTYAVENVAYYKEFRGFSSIRSFPVVNKIIIKNNYEAFQSPEFRGIKVVNMHTSGSTGTPFVVRQDKNKRDRVQAERNYLWGTAGFQTGMRYVFFRVLSSMNRYSRLDSWLRNVLLWDVQKLDKENLEKIRNTLKSARNIRMLIGYANTFEILTNYLLACGDSPEMFGLFTIISYGEALSKGTHDKLRRIFHCNIAAMYSNQENGMMAIECIENKEFHVNSASYYFELLKMDSDDPVSVGEPGRIVVTDLFNHAMPLIRYDTGDIGIWKEKAECGWDSQVFSSIQGRMTDLIFDTKGNTITPHIISLLMWPYDKLLQYQFIQEGAKQYTIKLNESEGCYEDASFVKLFKDVLGQDAEIVIERVHEIPVLESGKRKEVVRNYNPGKA